MADTDLYYSIREIALKKGFSQQKVRQAAKILGITRKKPHYYSEADVAMIVATIAKLDEEKHGRRRAHHLIVRVSDDEMQNLRTLATTMGITVSELVRRLPDLVRPEQNQDVGSG